MRGDEFVPYDGDDDGTWMPASLTVPDDAGDAVMLDALARAGIRPGQIRYEPAEAAIYVESDDSYRSVSLRPSSEPDGGWCPGELAGWAMTLFEYTGSEHLVGGTQETPDVERLVQTIVAWIA